MQRRRANARRVDEVARRARIEERRVHRCRGIEIGDVAEHAFGTAALVEVIVDQGDPLGGYCSRGKTSATM